MLNHYWKGFRSAKAAKDRGDEREIVISWDSNVSGWDSKFAPTGHLTRNTLLFYATINVRNGSYKFIFSPSQKPG